MKVIVWSILAAIALGTGFAIGVLIRITRDALGL